MSYEDEIDERSPVFHERIKELKEHGYRGFTITKSKPKWGGVEVTAKNKKGKSLTSSGETDEEAFKKIIDQIDYTLEKK